MSDDDKAGACKNDQRILSVAVEEIEALGCPAKEAGLSAWFAAQSSVQSTDAPLTQCLESLKCRLRVLEETPSAEWGKQALAALNACPL